MRKSSLRKYSLSVLLAVLLLLHGCATYQPTLRTGPRPSTWAVQVKNTADVPNLYKITDHIYRSGQPTEQGIAELVDSRTGMNIKTIIDLRQFHKNDVPSNANHLRIEQVPLYAGQIDFKIIDQAVIKVMKILSEEKNGPFLIHCKYGADRTGLMSAMYRIIYQNWSKEMAIDEMLNGEYGFHALWTNIIEYIEKADIGNLRNEIRQDQQTAR